MKTQLYQNNNLLIEQDTAFDGLLITWSGFTNDEEFRHCIDHAMSYLISHKSQRLIHDMSAFQGISLVAQEYASMRSKEITQQIGQIKRALIVPKDVFAKFSMNNVNQQTVKEDGQVRRSFANYTDACTWLNEPEV